MIEQIRSIYDRRSLGQLSDVEAMVLIGLVLKEAPEEEEARYSNFKVTITDFDDSIYEIDRSAFSWQQAKAEAIDEILDLGFTREEVTKFRFRVKELPND